MYNVVNARRGTIISTYKTHKEAKEHIERYRNQFDDIVYGTELANDLRIVTDQDLKSCTAYRDYLYEP